MRHSPLLTVLYALMAIWLLVAGARRIFLFLWAGQAVDWSPIVSSIIGGLALLALIPAVDDWTHRRDD